MINIEEMTVLIVDDMNSMCQFIHKMMKVVQYGRKFLFAHNGREALNILKKEPVDLVMLDYSMPVMSGAEVLSHIREDRNLRDLPVIMVTAAAFTDYVAEAGESGIDAYIIKPFNRKILEEKISLVIRKANNPPPMVAHLRRARDFEDEGDMDEAIREAHLAMEANPQATRPIRELGYYYFKKDELKEAEECFLKAADRNDLDVFAFHYLGELYLKLDDMEKASYYFEKAIRISPRHTSRGIHFGKILVQRNMIKRAVQVFDMTLELSGSTPELREKISDFCMEKGVSEYAVKLLESILKDQPNRTDLCLKLANLLKTMNQTQKAVNYLAKATKIDKENVDIKIQLAKDYLALEKPVLAEKHVREILKLDPDHEQAKEFQKKCL